MNASFLSTNFFYVVIFSTGVQHLLHLKSKSKILQPIEIMGFFMNFLSNLRKYFVVTVVFLFLM